MVEDVYAQRSFDMTELILLSSWFMASVLPLS